ncbi:response regulator [Paenibacillus piri]|nr:response regulator [Paenibacillus piri]
MIVLLVDDEYYARKALAQMIQDWEPDTIVYEAEDGLQALELLEKTQPHVVFSDICMPKVDGIQLAAHIAESYPAVFNVIISGFDDFKYAQKAIAYKVEQYLIKPADKDEIVELLNAIDGKLQAAAAQGREQRLAALLYEADEVKHELSGLDEPDSYVFAVVQAECADANQLQPVAAEALARCGLDMIAIPDRHYANMLVIRLALNEPLAAGKLSRLREQLNELIVTYTESTGKRLSAGIGGVHQDGANLQRAFIEAKTAMLHRLLCGSGKVHLYSEVVKNSRYSLELLDDMIVPLYPKIVKNQMKDVQETVNKIFELIVELGPSIYALNNACSKLIAVLNSVIETFNDRSLETKSYWERIDLYRFFSTDQIADHITRHLTEISKALEKSSPKVDVVEDIRQYVMHNYRHDIVLEDLAKNTYFTDPSYLSRLFKKKSGTCFSKFVTEVRMYNAKKLMETSPGLAVAEIADAVGFNDCSYFIQMYKKFFGETPGKSIKAKEV